MSKQKLLFLCVYLTALTLMGITLQFFIKIYLAGIYMNATWVSAPLTIFILITIVLFVRLIGFIEKYQKIRNNRKVLLQKENLLKTNLFINLKYFVQLR